MGDWAIEDFCTHLEYCVPGSWQRGVVRLRKTSPWLHTLNSVMLPQSRFTLHAIMIVVDVVVVDVLVVVVDVVVDIVVVVVEVDVVVVVVVVADAGTNLMPARR